MGDAIVKGTVYLTISVFIFLLANYILHIAVGRFLGPEMYGLFGVLMSLYLISDAFFGTGLPKAVSKFMSEHEEKKKYIYTISLKLQLVLTLIFSLFFIVFAQKIAFFLNDESLAGYIVFIGIMMIPLSLLSLYSSGFFNGLRIFNRQATVKIIHTVLRTILALLFLYFGFKLFGILAAFLIAQLTALIYCVFYLRIPSDKQLILESDKKTINAKKIVLFALPLVVASLAYSLVRNINVLFIKSFLSSDYLTGLFTAAATLSNIPLLAFAPVSLTLMPSISNAVGAKNIELVKKYVSQSTRYLLIMLLPATVMAIATSKELLQLLYSADYVAGAPVLSVLLIGSAFLTISSSWSSVITGMGKPKFELYCSILFLLVLSGLNFFLIPKLGLIGAAYAFLVTSVTAFLVIIIYFYKQFRTLMNVFSFLRISFCSGIIFVFIYLWHYSGFLLLINYVVLFCIYAFLLYAFGEINESDILRFKKIVGLAK